MALPTFRRPGASRQGIKEKRSRHKIKQPPKKTKPLFTKYSEKLNPDDER